MSRTASSMSIKTRLLLVIVVALVGMLVVSSFALMAEKSTLLDDRKIKTRHLVEAAHGVLAYYYGLQKSGALTEEAAKDAAIKAIKAMRYEQKEYFWLNDFTEPIPKMLMHPTVPALDGKILDAAKFNCATSLQAGLDGAVEKTDGKKNLFVAFNEVANKAGSGFVTYNWPKPKAGGGTTEELYTKLSYVKKFEGWNWLLGSGIYIDDVDSIFWQRASWLIAIVLSVTVVIGILMLVLIRSITRPLGELREAMKTIQTTQDLSRRVTVRANNEIGEIGHSFNEMVKSFQDIIHQVVAGVQDVMGSAAHLSQSSQRVAASSIQQSEASASMATAVEEMSVSIDHVAENSKGTHSIAQQAGELSSQGGEIVHNAAAEMTKIADSVNHSTQLIQTLGDHSHQISAIVNVIKEIADQTNLLALNAAIEAARAGEQGRGFAVVADEVRKLAERTTKSTLEISTMIGSIQSGTIDAVASMDEGTARVRDGVVMANQAGESMLRIREGASQVIASVSEIMDALREQSVASGQVAGSVEKIARMTEQNSSEVREIAQTAEHLEQLAGSLQNSVSQFRV
ncbi:MAG TPA: methyl-accepting chemotaxis protein [Sulfuricella sp.]|nr:methyl-accepting chemotaxis protein [Sulfuricella sp.]